MSPSDVSQLSRGDVVLVRFPFTDLTSDKRRPAIVVTDTGNVTGPDGHFVFMGSRRPPFREPHIVIRSGTDRAADMGLRFPPGTSEVFVRPQRLATLAVYLVTRRLGMTPADVLRELDAQLSAVLGI